MTKDIITFKLSGNMFAVDLQKVPLILKANQFLPEDSFLVYEYNVFKYGNTEVFLINIYELLKLVPKEINESSRILVGELENSHFGIVVESVMNIINLNGNCRIIDYPNSSRKDSFYKEIIEIEDQQFILLDIEKIFKKEILERLTL